MSRIRLGIASLTLSTLSICVIGPLGVPTLIRVALSEGCVGVELDNDEVEFANDEVELVNDELAPGVTHAGGVNLGCSSLRSNVGLISSR